MYTYNSVKVMLFLGVALHVASSTVHANQDDIKKWLPARLHDSSVLQTIDNLIEKEQMKAVAWNESNKVFDFGFIPIVNESWV